MKRPRPRGWARPKGHPPKHQTFEVRPARSALPLMTVTIDHPRLVHKRTLGSAGMRFGTGNLGKKKGPTRRVGPMTGKARSKVVASGKGGGDASGRVGRDRGRRIRSEPGVTAAWS